MSEDAPRAGAEAARLLEAAQIWLRQSAPHLAPVDDAGQTCSCPVCRGIVRLRESDPDSVARWVDGAVAAFERVVADITASRAGTEATDDPQQAGSEDPVRPAGPDAAESERPPSRRVRRVPLDDAGSDEPSTADPNAREE